MLTVTKQNVQNVDILNRFVDIQISNAMQILERYFSINTQKRDVEKQKL